MAELNNNIVKPSYLSLYKVLPVHIAFTLFNLVYNLLRNLVWMITGTYWKLRSTDYQGSAHVQRILLKHKFDVLAQDNDLLNFLTCHESFVDPEYVLRDEVSLYNITTDAAIFVEVESSKAEIWRSKFSPFSRHAQYKYAIKVITLPHSSFLHLTEQLGDTRSKVMFLHNTSRSGSTLMCRILEKTEVCVCWGEPEGLFSIINLINTKGITDPALGQRLLKAVIRIYCKPVITWKNKQPMAYCIKLICPAIFGAEMLHEMFPNYKQIFLYRHANTMMRSFEALAEAAPNIKLVTLIGSLHRLSTQFIATKSGYSNTICSNLNFTLQYNTCELGMFVWAGIVQKYIDCWIHNIPIKGVKFEDLVKDPHFCIKTIFKYFELPDTLIEPAMKALEEDSQENSPCSKKVLNKLRRKTTLMPENLKCLDRLCSYFGVPNWRRDFVLPDTITHRPVEDDPLFISDQELMDIYDRAGCITGTC